MAFWSTSRPPHHPHLPLLGLLSLLLLHPSATTTATRVGVLHKPPQRATTFREAPAFRNGQMCGSEKSSNNTTIHIVMTLDANYLRGTMAAVLSILQHSTCPENNFFHFLSLHMEPEIFSAIKSTFPYLNFKTYRFDSNLVTGKISKSVRQALDQPLNYARIYLSEILPGDVSRVIYLDSDIVVVDDIAKLWAVDLGGRVVAARNTASPTSRTTSRRNSGQT